MQLRGDFAAPGDAGQKDGQPRGTKLLQKLGDVVDQPRETGCVAPRRSVQTGAAPIEEPHRKPRLGQTRTGADVPAAVTLDAVDEDYLTRGRTAAYRRYCQR